jgi:hypothetical protein
VEFGARQKKMPIVDVVVCGAVVDSKLRYKMPDVTAGVERVELLGYSIKRTHPNISELNNCIDFKVGSTALSGVRVADYGHGYDPDNPPRLDGAAPLGVTVNVMRGQRREAVELGDYVEVGDPVVLVRASVPREFGDDVVDFGVAAPFAYSYRVLFNTASLAEPAVSRLANYAPVVFAVAGAWFELGAEEARALILASYNAAAALAAAPLLHYSAAAGFVLRHSADFAAVDHTTLAYLLCGFSPRRHARRRDLPPTAMVRALTAGPVGRYRAFASKRGASFELAFADPDGVSHDARVLEIAEDLTRARRMVVDAEFGAVYTARLRPGHYPIGSVLHAPYPAVLGVEQARHDVAEAYDTAQLGGDAAHLADLYLQQRHYGLVPQKSLGISRRQAADGLIKEVQDAMNYAVNEAEFAKSGAASFPRVDSDSLCALFPQYAHTEADRPALLPHVYDTNVPHVDNPCGLPFMGADTRGHPYDHPHDVGHQPPNAANRRRQSVYVTLENAGGGVEADGAGRNFARARPTLETAAWNGFRAGRVRISTRENRVGDAAVDPASQAASVIGADADARGASAVAQRITLLFGSGPSAARSAHRALGFLARDYTRPRTFLTRKPVVAVRDDVGVNEVDDGVTPAVTAAVGDTTVELEDATTTRVHIPNASDCTYAGALPDGLVYVRPPMGINAARQGGVVYNRYVPPLAVQRDALTDPPTEAPVTGTAARPLRDVEFRYKGGVAHMAYYETLGYQAEGAYTLDSDPLVLAIGLALNDRRHTDAERVQAAGVANFALLPIGMADHAEPRTMHDGSAYQTAMLNYKLDGYTTAPHAAGADRCVSGCRNFGRVQRNAQESPGARKYSATNAEAVALASRDAHHSCRTVTMLKTGDFGTKVLTLDEPTTVSTMCFTFAVPGTSVAYDFGAQEVTLLVRLHTQGSSALISNPKRA